MSTKILTKEEKIYLKGLKKEIQRLEKEDKMLRPIMQLPQGTWAVPLAKLYENRIEGEDGVMYLLDNPKMKISLSQTGDVHFSTKVSGGETYTGSISGMVVGGLIAGPIGAAMGALAPHSNGVKTEEVKHDTRCLVLEIAGPKGSIVLSEPFVDQNGKEKKNFQLKLFHNKLLEAKNSYKKNKKAIDKKYVDVMGYWKEYDMVENDYSTSTKVIKNNQKAKKPTLSRKTSDTGKTALIISIVSACLFFVPYINLILGIIGLILAIKSSKDYGRDGKTTVAIILSSVNILWGFLYADAWLNP